MASRLTTPFYGYSGYEAIAVHHFPLTSKHIEMKKLPR